jgi:hypothetical protein
MVAIASAATAANATPRQMRRLASAWEALRVALIQAIEVSKDVAMDVQVVIWSRVIESR